MALATLADFRLHLNIPTTDGTGGDAELQGFLDAAVAVVENITGPMTSRTVTEHHSGNGLDELIVLRQRPATSVTTVTEYVWNQLRDITIVSALADSTIYSCSFDAERGHLVRRYTSGTAVAWAKGTDNITVTYVAGAASVPANVRLGTLLVAAHLFQSTQLGGRPSWAGSGAGDDAFSAASGYAIPNRVRELLQPNERTPGIA